MTTPDPDSLGGTPASDTPLAEAATPPAGTPIPPAAPSSASSAAASAGSAPSWATPPPPGPTPPPGAAPYGSAGAGQGSGAQAPGGQAFGAGPGGQAPGEAYGAGSGAQASAGQAYGAGQPYGAGYGAPPPNWPGASDRRDTQPPGLVFGVILVVVGVLFLALRLGNITLGPNAWPLWLIVPGLAMLIASMFVPSRGGLGLAIPGTILAIIGGILWVQETYDLYATWAYAWALVAPTGPGLAMLLYGIVHGDGDIARDGLGTTVTGLALFVGFGLFFEGVLGISGHRIDHLDQVLPFAAIGLGVVLIAMAFIDGGRHDRWRDQQRADHRAQRRAAKEQRRAEKAARRAAR
jgi:hypothetical protein